MANNEIVICVDKGQKDGKHEIKHKEIAIYGNLVFVPLPYGDYIQCTPQILSVINRRGNSLKKMDFCGLIPISVDTKKDMQEMYGDIYGDHKRFRDECILAQNNGCELIVLVENDNNIKELSEVHKWDNPRISRYYYFKKLKEQGKAQNLKLASKPPCSSKQLQETMETMQEKYGITFLFCTKEECGIKIIELLTNFEKEI